MYSHTHSAWHLARILSGCPVDPDFHLMNTPQPYQTLLEAVLNRGESNPMTVFEQTLFRLPHALASEIQVLVMNQDPRQPPQQDADDLKGGLNPNNMATDQSTSLTPPLPRQAHLEGDWRMILKDHWLTEYCRFAAHRRAHVFARAAHLARPGCPLDQYCPPCHRSPQYGQHPCQFVWSVRRAVDPVPQIHRLLGRPAIADQGRARASVVA